MALLSLDEIQQELDEKFIPLEPMLTGLRLLSRQTSDSPRNRWMEQPGAVLPGGLLELASQFDLGRLTIGPVTFGARGDYTNDLDSYNAEVLEDQPDLIVFALSDPFSYALGRDGAVYALDPEDDSLSNGAVASSVEQFLRGVGTVFLRRTDVPDKAALANEVADQVGASNRQFWRWLAS